MLRSSFSQHTVFENCRRWWYYQYVEKIIVPSDMCYADAGNVVHDILENWYNNKYSKFDDAKEEFNKLWDKANLNISKIALKKDEYWLMCINGIQKDIKVTSTEFKIFYPDVLGFLDCVNTETDEIYDWKTGKRDEDSENNYQKQLQFYSWLYFRKFNRLPKKVGIIFLKYNGNKNILEKTFTFDEVNNIQVWYKNILEQMEVISNLKIPPSKCETCHQYCPYEEMCNKQTDSLNFTLNIRGGYIYVDGIITPLLNKGLDKKFSYELKNAYFMKKANPHARTTVKFWNISNKSIPLGFLDGVIKTLNDYADYNKVKLNLAINDNRQISVTKLNMPEKFINNVTLRDYQIQAVNKLIEKKIGILEIGTGGGKTEIAIECIRQLKVRTLFVVDKIELLKQTKKRIEESLGIEVGMIGCGNNEIKDITVATIQTLNKNINRYRLYLESVEFIILDECHKVASISYYRLGGYLTNTQNRLGLCLDKKTHIIMNNGHTKEIKNIKIGDKVLSYNENKKEIEEDIVKNTFINNVEEIYEISVKKRNGNIKKIKCSGEHKFFVNEKYICAKDLLKGQQLIVLSGMHSLLDNGSKKEEARKKISEKLKGQKHWWKNPAAWKIGHNAWNKNKTKNEFPQIASHRKGLSLEDEYGTKAFSMKNNMSIVAKNSWKEKYNDIIFKINKTRSNNTKYPWLTYNKRKKLLIQTNQKGEVICEHCNKHIEGYKKLHCHYINKNKKNNSIENLMIAHAKCHTYLDKHKKDKNNARFIK